jgi:hypothetical protein
MPWRNLRKHYWFARLSSDNFLQRGGGGACTLGRCGKGGRCHSRSL